MPTILVFFPGKICFFFFCPMPVLWLIPLPPLIANTLDYYFWLERLVGSSSSVPSLLLLPTHDGYLFCLHICPLWLLTTHRHRTLALVGLHGGFCACSVAKDIYVWFLIENNLFLQTMILQPCRLPPPPKTPVPKGIIPPAESREHGLWDLPISTPYPAHHCLRALL